MIAVPKHSVPHVPYRTRTWLICCCCSCILSAFYPQSFTEKVWIWVGRGEGEGGRNGGIARRPCSRLNKTEQNVKRYIGPNMFRIVWCHLKLSKLCLTEKVILCNKKLLFSPLIGWYLKMIYLSANESHRECMLEQPSGKNGREVLPGPGGRGRG